MTAAQNNARKKGVTSQCLHIQFRIISWLQVEGNWTTYVVVVAGAKRMRNTPSFLCRFLLRRCLVPQSGRGERDIFALFILPFLTPYGTRITRRASWEGSCERLTLEGRVSLPFHLPNALPKVQYHEGRVGTLTPSHLAMSLLYRV